jgi:triacylglycerol lipase
MPQLQHIFLIPGFFGFANIGELLYFSHVSEFLREACARLHITADIHTVQTHPTASLRLRAERLLEAMQDKAGGDRHPIHLIGHSSGGIDARLLVSPGVSLHSNIEVEPLAARVRSLVMLSAPNHGTPVASFFTSLFGQKLLQLLSLGTIYVLRFGRLPRSVLFRLAAAFTRLDDLVGWRHNVADELRDRLLADFSPEPRQAVEQFLGEIGGDQSLMPQLTPEGMDLFNAATSDRPSVRYGTVVSYARRPGLLSTLAVGLDPYGQATHALFFGLYRMASGMPADHLPELSQAQVDSLLNTYGMIPDPAANDGVVPTVSQIYGEIVHATRADHLDVLGHFADGIQSPPHIDWVRSGTAFGRGDFEALWNDVASFLAGRCGAHGVAPRSRVRHLLHLFKR